MYMHMSHTFKPESHFRPTFSSKKFSLHLHCHLETLGAVYVQYCSTACVSFFCPSVTLFSSFHPLTFISPTDVDESLVLLRLPLAPVQAWVQHVDPSLPALGGSSTWNQACHHAPLGTMDLQCFLQQLRMKKGEIYNDGDPLPASSLYM